MLKFGEAALGKRCLALCGQLLVIVAALFSVVFIWAPSLLLVTTDGPSHIYNALLAHYVRGRVQPFDSLYTTRDIFRSNFVTDSFLGLVGPLLGWERSEKVLVTIILLGAIAAFFITLRRALERSHSIIISCWLANNWFVWMGFYDFSLSVIVFLAFVYVISCKKCRYRWLLIGALLVSLYATHLFTFALSIGVATWVFSWRALHDRDSWLPLAALLPAAALVVNEVMRGPVSHGGISWTSGWFGAAKAAIGLVIGDTLITFTWIGALVGVCFMAATWLGVIIRFRDRTRSWASDSAGLDVLAISLFALCVIVPDEIGAGAYPAARIRFLATVMLLPSTARSIARFKIATSLLLPTCLGVGLIIQTVWIWHVSGNVAEHVNAMSALLRSAGVPQGGWVSTRLKNEFQPFFRIFGYRHLSNRAYVRVRACGLDNYEAPMKHFEVVWTQVPDGLVFKAAPRGWFVSREINERPLGGNEVWVLHDSDHSLISADKDLTLGQIYYDGQFAVTRLNVAVTHSRSQRVP